MMGKRNDRWLPLAAMVGGLCLVVLGASEVYRVYRYEAAAKEIRSMFAAATLSTGPETRGQSRVRVVDSVSDKLDREAGTRESIPNDEIPRLRLAASDLIPTDKFVRPLPATAPGQQLSGAGTREDPWVGLQRAIEQLRPGDRLIVLNGLYRDTYGVGLSAANGTPEKPITLYFASDAQMLGAAPLLCETEVLFLDRSHWIFEGLNLSPQGCPTGVRVGRNVRAATFNSPHIYASSMDGIVVVAGASGVKLNNPHLHHLGTLEGKDPAVRGTQNTPEDSKHAAIRAPLQSVTLSGGKIHNVFGAPLILVGEDGAIVAGDNLLALVDRWDISVNEGQQKWW